MNYRLLQYKNSYFDYDKLKLKVYYKKEYNRLLLNYIWHKTNNIEFLVKSSRKLSGPKWFKNIKDLNIMPENYDKLSKDDLWLTVLNNRCKICNKLIYANRTTCSNKCSNLYKAKNPEYLKKLSDSIKVSHSNESDLNKHKRYNNVSKQLIEYNNKLTDQERKEKYANKSIRLKAYSNLSTRFPNIKLLFNQEFYYNEKYLPVQCKRCGFKWEMTKTTTMSRYMCVKCNPYKKHKTQTKIFDYINEKVRAKENCKSTISNELDIICKELNFAVEYNGLLPHSFGKSKVSYYNNFNVDPNYHLLKTEECEELNIHLFHIFENEFIDTSKQQIWYSMISNKMGLNKRIFARKCVLKEVSGKDSKEFMNANHLQGHTNSTIKIGLYYNDELLSLMTFRKHEKYQWEIARFATRCGFNVIGGASKLLKYFEINYKPISLLSFANRRWSQGKLYEKLNFTFEGNTDPNHFWFKENENILYSREKFQKHKLKDKLEIYDDNKTAFHNMFDNDYRVIFDCGNKKYVKYY